MGIFSDWELGQTVLVCAVIILCVIFHFKDGGNSNGKSSGGNSGGLNSSAGSNQ